MTPPEMLGEALRAGAADVERRSALLDRINVFPVADGDTGTNLVQTLSALAGASARDRSRAILLAARGNSGVILAQYLSGLLDRLGESFDAVVFASAARSARDLAYRAVSNPVEGTILTAMDDLSGLLDEMEEIADMERHRALEARLAEAVARTPAMMPRLARAGVVDAGALGFHLLACGLTLALVGLADPEAALARIRDRREGRDTAPLGGIADRVDPMFLESAERATVHRRYCVDLIVEMSAPADQHWIARFEAIGSSVEVAASGDLVKLHLHCDDPAAAERIAGEIGRVSARRVDDMVASMSLSASRPGIAHVPERAVTVVGDGAMSLSYDISRSLGVERFETYVQGHGRSFGDSEIDREEMFRRMRAGQVYTTSGTSAAEIRGLLDRYAEAPGRLVYLAVGRAYTGIQDLVREVARDHPAGERLTVLDTAAASGQQGLAVLAAARAAEGSDDAEDVARIASEQIASCREYLVVDDLRYLARTGRIGRVRSALAGALSVRPVIGHGGDGAVTIARTRSSEAALDEIARRAAAHPGEGRTLAMIEHTDDMRWIDRVRERLAEALPGDAEIVTCPLSSTSAVHMGPGTWGVAVTRVR